MLTSSILEFCNYYYIGNILEKPQFSNFRKYLASLAEFFSVLSLSEIDSIYINEVERELTIHFLNHKKVAINTWLYPEEIQKMLREITDNQSLDLEELLLENLIQALKFSPFTFSLINDDVDMLVYADKHKIGFKFKKDIASVLAIRKSEKDLENIFLARFNRSLQRFTKTVFEDLNFNVRFEIIPPITGFIVKDSKYLFTEDLSYGWTLQDGELEEINNASEFYYLINI